MVARIPLSPSSGDHSSCTVTPVTGDPLGPVDTVLACGSGAPIPRGAPSLGSCRVVFAYPPDHDANPSDEWVHTPPTVYCTPPTPTTWAPQTSTGAESWTTLHGRTTLDVMEGVAVGWGDMDGVAPDMLGVGVAMSEGDGDVEGVVVYVPLDVWVGVCIEAVKVGVGGRVAVGVTMLRVGDGEAVTMADVVGVGRILDVFEIGRVSVAGMVAVWTSHREPRYVGRHTHSHGSVPVHSITWLVPAGWHFWVHEHVGPSKPGLQRHWQSGHSVPLDVRVLGEQASAHE